MIFLDDTQELAKLLYDTQAVLTGVAMHLDGDERFTSDFCKEEVEGLLSELMRHLDANYNNENN